ncbi:MAG TPA: acetylxylan esterase [Fimbriimonadaceae bacterium]|nr:acetylxylan esterase [Fimbriimonadaceae bacterium]
MTLQSPNPPEGFSAFWEATVSEASSAPLSYSRKKQSEVVREGFAIDTLELRGVDGRTLHGWFAYGAAGAAPSPERHGAAGAAPSPGFVWLAPYGRWSMLPNEYGTRAGFCSLCINFHGESAFHREDYTPERGYFTDGIESPETWVFRRLFQDSLLSLRILAELSECDAGRLAAAGMSQGGGFAIWLGAFCDLTKCVCADMPFGAAREIVFSRPIHRYPLKEVVDYMDQSETHRKNAMRTMSFFDTVNIAALCKVPTLLTYGSKDPAVREFEVRSIENALPGEKRVDEIDGGHDWHPTMVDRNREWMLSHL